MEVDHSTRRLRRKFTLSINSGMAVRKIGSHMRQINFLSLHSASVLILKPFDQSQCPVECFNGLSPPSQRHQDGCNLLVPTLRFHLSSSSSNSSFKSPKQSQRCHSCRLPYSCRMDILITSRSEKPPFLLPTLPPTLKPPDL